VSRRLGQRLIALLGVAVCVALLGAAVTSAASGGEGRFSGKTAQGYPLRLAADQHHAQLIRVKVKLRCRDGGLLYDDLSDFEAADLRNGRFDDLQRGSGDEVHWRGSFNGDTARGSIRVKDKLKNGVRCDSGTVGFTVRRAGN